MAIVPNGNVMLHHAFWYLYNSVLPLKQVIILRIAKKVKKNPVPNNVSDANRPNI